MRNRFLLLAGLLVVGGLAALYLVNRQQVAVADDASHTTTLSSTTYDFGSGAENAVVATLVSTSSGDVLGKILISRKPSGGSTYTTLHVGQAPTDGSQSGVDMDAAVSYGIFASGDTVQAQFSCYDSSSNSTFSYTRTITIP